MPNLWIQPQAIDDRDYERDCGAQTVDPDFASLLQKADYPRALLVTQLRCDVEVSGPPREVGGEALAETELLVTQTGLVKLRG